MHAIYHYPADLSPARAREPCPHTLVRERKKERQACEGKPTLMSFHLDPEQRTCLTSDGWVERFLCFFWELLWNSVEWNTWVQNSTIISLYSSEGTAIAQHFRLSPNLLACFHSLITYVVNSEWWYGVGGILEIWPRRFPNQIIRKWQHSLKTWQPENQYECDNDPHGKPLGLQERCLISSFTTKEVHVHN